MNPVSRKFSCKAIPKTYYPITNAKVDQIRSYVTSMITFMEKKYSFWISNISIKFAFGADERPYFIGAFDCYAEIFNQGMSQVVKKNINEEYEIKDFETALENNRHVINEFNPRTLLISRKTASMPKIKLNVKYSKKLLHTFINDRCGGDFC